MCPIDFKVYDENGVLLGYVDQGEVWYKDDIIRIEVNGDVKTLYISDNIKPYIEFIATDDGVMNYVLQELNDGEVVASLNYYDVPLVEGNMYTQNITDKNLNGTLSQFPLLSVDAQQLSANEYIDDFSASNIVQISSTSNTGGRVIGDGDYPKGSAVALYAIPTNESYRFDGWYVNGQLVETDSTYHITALEDVEVNAVFNLKKIEDDNFAVALGEDYKDFARVNVFQSNEKTNDIVLRMAGIESEELCKTVTLKKMSVSGDTTSNTKATMFDDVYSFWLYGETLDSPLTEIYDSENNLVATISNKAFNDSSEVLVKSIILNQKSGQVDLTNTLQLNATITPSNATDPTLIWSSDTPSVATVDQTGLVTAISVGKATITAKAQDGSGVKASCVVEVTGGSNNGGNNTGGGNSSGSGNISTGGSNSSGGGNTSTGGDGSSGGGNSSTGGSGSSGGGNTSTGGNGSSGGGNTSTGGNGSSGGGSTSSGGNNTHTGGSSTTPGTGNTSTADEPTIKALYYIVNFDKNGGKNLSRRKMTLLQDDSLGILPKVERKNYKFLGWYTQPAGGKKVTQKTVLNVSTTLHAHWEKIAKPSKEQITSLNSKKAGSVAVKYKKLSGIKGYEIAYSTNKQFTSASTKRVVAGSTGKTLTKLKSGKTYYVKVRAYKTDSTGKKIYGAYSNVRSVQVK